MKHYYYIFKVFDFTFADGPTERVKLDPEKDPTFHYRQWASREEVVQELLRWSKQRWPNRELLRIDKPLSGERLYTKS